MTPDRGSATGAAVWRVLLGDRPVTRALRHGELTSPMLRLEFADVPVPNKAFKRVVRDLEFDVAELALMTFLMARSRGVPLRLLPVALFGRNPLPYLVQCVDRGRLAPRDLMGRRVGVRAYTTTTAVWTRAILDVRFGVDRDRVQWIACDEGHVAGVADPPTVRRAAPGANLGAMLLDGTIDAAIVDPVPASPRIATVVPDPAGAHRAWEQATGARTVNHVVVVRDSLARDRERMTELFRLFHKSRARAETEVGPAALPLLGFDAMRRSLEVAIEVAEAERLLAQPLTVEDLVTEGLASLTERSGGVSDGIVDRDC